MAEQRDRVKQPTSLRAVIVVVLCAVVAGSDAAPAHHQPSADSVPANVQEVPQRAMTVSGGGAGPFPFNRGEPFVMDPANVPQHHGPIAGFGARPPGPRSADVSSPVDDYESNYEYDTSKMEEVKKTLC